MVHTFKILKSQKTQNWNQKRHDTHLKGLNIPSNSICNSSHFKAACFVKTYNNAQTTQRSKTIWHITEGSTVLSGQRDYLVWNRFSKTLEGNYTNTRSHTKMTNNQRFKSNRNKTQNYETDSSVHFN